MFAQKNAVTRRFAGQKLGVRVNELLTATLKYKLLSDAAALKRMVSNQTALLPKYSAYLAALFDALIIKFNGVQRQKAVEDSLFNDIATLPTQQPYYPKNLTRFLPPKIGKGTRFIITLPMDSANKQTAGVAEPAPFARDRQRPAHAASTACCKPAT